MYGTLTPKELRCILATLYLADTCGWEDQHCGKVVRAKIRRKLCISLSKAASKCSEIRENTLVSPSKCPKQAGIEGVGTGRG